MAHLTPEKASKYRYRLIELAKKAAALPAFGKITIEKQALLLEEEYGISPVVFFSDRYLTKKRKTVIPETRLLAYARFYNVKESEIRNDAAQVKRTLAEMVHLAERRNAALPLPVSPEASRVHA